MTTTQAQGQFHHLETKQDADRGSIHQEVWILLSMSPFVRARARVCVCVSVCAGKGEGEQKIQEGTGDKNQCQPSKEVFLEKSFDAQDGQAGNAGWVTEAEAI